MHIRLSTLAENSASWLGLLAEWGLSILVETDDATVLVDTGRSNVAAYNARIMKVDLEKIDKIMFSHGHEDHTGGLVDLLRLRDMPEIPVEVIAHPDAWAPKYWRSPDGNRYNYIGIPYARKLAESLGASFRLTPDPVWITDRIVTSGEVPMLTDFEEIDASACVETDDGYAGDLLRDDQSLFITSDKGLILVCGCAHRGIVNTIRRAQDLTGSDDVYAIVGGIHLFGASERRVRLTLDEIKRLDVQRIGVSHCTGPSASAFLAHELGNRFFFNQAGTCTEFDV
ncbi:MAG: MBL fold metallo-hydrolase [Deltaproteobacteria bacterium]|nr:MBL fold metallo-hydrolase [Deltaproteobacteria bacterium]